MSSNPLVSFIIPVFNGEKYIREAVESCLSQTHQPVEVVVTDDGSTDATLKVLRSHFAGRTNVKFDSFEQNRGKVAAYNHCYKNCSGEFIAVLDADDVAMPDRAENSIKALEEHGAALIGGDALLVGPRKEPEIGIAQTWFGLDRTQALTFDALLRKPQVLGPTVFATRAVCGEIFPMDERMSHQDWWMPLAAAYRNRVMHFHAPLVKYRIHESNTSRINPDLGFDRWLEITAREIHYFEQVIARFELTPEQANFCNCRMRTYELLKERSFSKRLAAGFSGLGLAFRAGVPPVERAKYFIAMISPRQSFRLSMAVMKRMRAKLG